MGFEARHNGVLVAKHEDPDHLKKTLSHLEEGLEISEGRPYELHAVGGGADAIIDSFQSLEEARSKHAFYTNPIIEDGVEIRKARFPNAEVRMDGAVVHPAVVEAPSSELAEPPADTAPAESEATTEPAPPETAA